MSGGLWSGSLKVSVSARVCFISKDSSLAQGAIYQTVTLYLQQHTEIWEGLIINELSCTREDFCVSTQPVLSAKITKFGKQTEKSVLFNQEAPILSS